MLKGTTEEELRGLGVDARSIALHQQRIIGRGQNKAKLHIPIIDTCRLDNGGIMPQKFLSRPPAKNLGGFVAFVPAAGAASRYFKDLQDLRRALVSGRPNEITTELVKLRAQGADTWPLPLAVAGLLHGATDYAAAIREIDAPKALLPYCVQGESFLQRKAWEHGSIDGLDAQVFVAPIGQSQEFARHLQASGREEKPSAYLEQGISLSTLRFLPDGSPYRDEEGQLSLVPAGHGMLVKLFPEVKRLYPQAHSLLIRNIDNVLPEDAETKEAFHSFMRQHQSILESLVAIREDLHKNHNPAAAAKAKALLSAVSSRWPLPPDAWLERRTEAYRPLWLLLTQVFQCPLHLADELQTRLGEIQALTQLFDRPLNTLGQVPNSGKDVGGSPVLAHADEGPVSICLELPHASTADRQTYLENPTRATHFNPVFVAAELAASDAPYDLESCPFWILAEKNIQGQAVVYHEIVLYEILGNSFTANVLFPEIPRSLFHPHKSLLDGVKK